MTTIHFDDAIRPIRSNGSVAGVYSTRNISRASNIGEKDIIKEVEIDELENQKSSRHEGDIRKKQVSSSTLLAKDVLLNLLLGL